MPSSSSDDPQLPMLRRTAYLTRPEPPQLPAMPVTQGYPPGKMDLVPGIVLRDDSWPIMEPQVRDRIGQLAGEIIAWWAHILPGSETRPEGVVVGRNAAVFADPRYDTQHRPVYVLDAFDVDPGFGCGVPVEHRPPPRGRGAGREPSAGPPAVTPIKGLTAEAQGILGNLPPLAQELLTAPFRSDKVLRCRWHYEGSADRLNMFGIVLAGTRDVTLATGTKLVPVGHTDASAHWSLTCYWAAVISRREIVL